MIISLDELLGVCVERLTQYVYPEEQARLLSNSQLSVLSVRRTGEFDSHWVY